MKCTLKQKWARNAFNYYAVLKVFFAKTGTKMMVGCKYRHIQNIDKNYTEYRIDKIEISMTPLIFSWNILMDLV